MPAECQTPRLKKRGKLANSFFFLIQLTLRQWLADKTEFANRGKLTWQTGKLNGRLRGLARPLESRRISIEPLQRFPGQPGQPWMMPGQVLPLVR